MYKADIVKKIAVSKDRKKKKQSQLNASLLNRLKEGDDQSIMPLS